MIKYKHDKDKAATYYDQPENERFYDEPDGENPNSRLSAVDADWLNSVNSELKKSIEVFEPLETDNASNRQLAKYLEYFWEMDRQTIGSVIALAYNAPTPRGYLSCNGADVDWANYRKLYSVIGGLYGRGAGFCSMDDGRDGGYSGDIDLSYFDGEWTLEAKTGIEELDLTFDAKRKIFFLTIGDYPLGLFHIEDVEAVEGGEFYHLKFDSEFSSIITLTIKIKRALEGGRLILKFEDDEFSETFILVKAGGHVKLTVENTFKLPDFRGAFLRGHGGNSADFGVRQEDALQEHRHNMARSTIGPDIYGNSHYAGYHVKDSYEYWISNVLGARVANETRPVNYAVKYFIKHGEVE